MAGSVVEMICENSIDRKFGAFTLAGVIIGIISLLILEWTGRDLNDQNEILLYAIRDLWAGQNPYANQYTIGVFDLHEQTYFEYEMFFGYMPLVLLLYMPVLIWPHQIGIIQFQPIFFSMNIVMTFWLYWDLYRRNKYVAVIFWLNPIVYFGCYMGFMAQFIFPYFTLVYLHKRFKCGVLLMISILVYQLWVILAIPVFIYQLRPHLNWENITPFIFGILSLLPIPLGFLWWDWDAFLASILYSNLGRFNTNHFQYILLGCLFSLSFGLLRIKNDDTALLFLLGLITITICLQNIILNLGLDRRLDHYLTLLVPIGLFFSRCLVALPNHRIIFCFN